MRFHPCRHSGRQRAMVNSHQERPIKLESVQFLLHEYDTLRAETIQRHSSLYQIVNIVAAAFAAISYLVINSLSVPHWLFWAGLGPLIVAIVGVIIFSQLFIR